MPSPNDNGILAAVHGEFISQGAKTLPDPTGRKEAMKVEIEAAHVGMVRITYEPFHCRHAKTHRSAWVAKHAERV